MITKINILIKDKRDRKFFYTPLLEPYLDITNNESVCVKDGIKNKLGEKQWEMYG